MPTREDLLLGQAAVARGLLGEEQFWSLLQELNASPSRALADLLLARGLATGIEIDELRETSRRLAQSIVELTRSGAPAAGGPAATLCEPAPGAQPPTMLSEPATRLGTLPAPPVGDPTAAGSPPPTFGKYRLLGELGRGGMGVVYKALDPDSHRTVALKVLPPGSGNPEDRVQRFQREVRTAASLRHPHIVAIHDVGVVQDTHFFTMDFVAGRSLADVLAERPLPAREGVEIIAQVADALDHAHRNGVVHRDLKPSNILLDGGGKPYLTDFGLAKEIESNTRLTVSGQIMGTPSYMSPEQANGELAAVDAKSDVYSLGAVLYECLTRVPPFTGASPAAILYKTLQEDPAPVRKLNPRVHADVETICLKSLQKEKERRYASAADFARDLQRFLDGEPIEARPVSALYRGLRAVRKNRLAFAALVVAGAVVLGLTHHYRSTTAEIERRLAADREQRERRGRAEILLRKASLLRGAERVAALDEAARADPGYVEALRDLGLARMALGDFARAHDGLTNTLRAAPGDAFAELALARLDEECRFDPATARTRWARVAAAEGAAPLGRFAEACGARAAGDPERACALLQPLLDHAPLRAWAHRELARAQLAAGRLGEASRAAARALDLAPDDASPALVLAQAAWEDRRGEEALGHLDRLLSRAALVPDAHALQGEVWFLSGDPEKAIGAASRALDAADMLAADLAAANAAAPDRDWPGRARALGLRGRAHLLRGAHREASENLQAALALEPRSAPCLTALGRVALEEDKPDEARRRFDEAIAADPGFAEALGQRALLVGAEEDTGRREQLLLRSRDASARADTPWGRELARGWEAVDYFMHNVREDRSRLALAQPAETAFRRALLENSLCARAYVGLALTALCCLEQKRACELLAQAIEANPLEAQAWMHRGAIVRDWPETGRTPEDAGADLEQAVRLDPGNGEAWVQRGLWFERQARWEEAVTAYDRAVEAQPDLGAAYHRRAECRFALGQKDLGRADFERWRAAPIQESLARYYRGLAIAFEQRRENERALCFFDAAIDRHWRHEDTYMERGQVHQRKQRFGHYLLDFARALEVQPNLETRFFIEVMTARMKMSFLFPVAAKEFAPIVKEMEFEPAAQFMMGFLDFVLGDGRAAIGRFEKCLELNPAFVSARTFRGYLLARAGRTEEGMAELRRAQEICDKSGLAPFYHACLAAEAGRHEEARAQLELAVRNGFYNRELARSQRELKGYLEEPWFQALFRGR